MDFGFEALLTNPDRVLAYFTLAADLTTLRAACRFARSREAMMARYEGLPFAALAFLGEDSGQLVDLASQLVGPDETFYLLLNEQQARLAERAFVVEQVQTWPPASLTAAEDSPNRWWRRWCRHMWRKAGGSS